jgi:hypothetical protein
VEVVGRAAHRQRVERPSSRLLIQSYPRSERVRIEQIREVADGVGEIDEPIVESPFGDIVAKEEVKGKIGWLAGLECCHDIVLKFVLLIKR